jgi:murein DD-endopeptidase MepM/ murein hydrolase activator NlpD
MVPEKSSIGLKKKHAPILAIAFCMLLPALTGSSVLNARHTAFDNQPGRSFAVTSDLWRVDGVNFPVYDRSSEKQAIFNIGNPFNVFTGHAGMTTQTRFLSGTITSSLWHSISEKQADPELVSRLGEVFAGRVDFGRLGRGDRFEVIYDVQYAEGKRIGLGDIRAVVLASDGEAHQAFRFSFHGTTGYYDENGRNLQKAFLESPLMNARISSGFQDRRLHPIKKVYRRHPAIDYAAPAGSPVMSVGGGIVTDKGYSRSSGNYIKIRHSGTYSSFYLHLSAFSESIKINKPVRKGEIIGFVGSTGWSTGPHLDFRFMKNGRYVDYASADLPAGNPVDTDCLPQFRQNVAQYHKQLASV